MSTFTSAMAEVKLEPSPANSRPIPNSSRASDPASGSRVADAWVRLSTFTPCSKKTAAATITMAELISQPRSMAREVSPNSYLMSRRRPSSSTGRSRWSTTFECR